AEMLVQTTILILNYQEACAAAGQSPDSAPPPGDRQRHARHLAQALLARGPDTVVVTLGAEGAVACARGQLPLFQPAFAVQALDTIGAGDAFTAALACGLAVGMPLAHALREAAAAGALATQAL